MKKVSFGGKRPTLGAAPTAEEIDDWVAKQANKAEPIKRLTIDVPISLHKRVKSRCALEDLVMADVIRDLLEQRFPRNEPFAAAVVSEPKREGEGEGEPS